MKSFEKLSSFSRETFNIPKPSISVWINITTSILIKELTCVWNINSKKEAGLINFYLASNNIMNLLSYSRSKVSYSQGTKINTEVDFPDQTSHRTKDI